MSRHDGAVAGTGCADALCGERKRCCECRSGDHEDRPGDDGNPGRERDLHDHRVERRTVERAGLDRGRTFPAALTATWTCVGAGGGTCTASGSGNINDAVNLPVGGSVTYTVTATISAAATGSLSNTATVTPPAGVTDPSPANNSATDTDTLTPQADLAITKTDGVTTATPGGSVTYTITASNAGPSNASGSTVADGSFTFTPKPGFVGAVTFTYVVVDIDGGTSAPARVTSARKAPSRTRRVIKRA